MGNTMTTQLSRETAGVRADLMFAQALRANNEKYNGYGDIATLILGTGDAEADDSRLARNTRKRCMKETRFLPIIAALFSVNPLIGMVAGAIFLGNRKHKEEVSDAARCKFESNIYFFMGSVDNKQLDADYLGRRFNSFAPMKDQVDYSTVTRDELKVKVAKLAVKKDAIVDKDILDRALKLVPKK